MMEKQKKEASRFSKRQLWGCLGFVFFVFAGICGTLMIVLDFAGQMTRTSLAPEMLPTAEALLDIPYWLTLPDRDASISLDVWEGYGGKVGATRICVQIQADEQYLQTYKNNSQLFIDEGRVFFPAWGYYNSSSDRYLCAYGELQPGIHLIEFHLKDSFWGEPIHIQQWAIEID